MKLKIFLISALAMASTTKVFANCYGAGSVSHQASSVSHFANQLSYSLLRTSFPQIRHSSELVANLSQQLSLQANDYAINCNIIHTRFNALNHAFIELSQLITYTQNQNARNDFSYLSTEFMILRQLMSELRSVRPGRVIVHPVPVPRPGRRYGPVPPRHRHPVPVPRPPRRRIPRH